LTTDGSNETPAQLLKRGSDGRAQLRSIDGKTIWRKIADLVPPDDDAPATVILISAALPSTPSRESDVTQSTEATVTPGKSERNLPQRPSGAGDSLASRMAEQRKLRSEQRLASSKALTASLGGGGETCDKCKQICYVAERAQSTPGDKIMHRACFTCEACGKLLSTTGWQPAVKDGVECYFCPTHAVQQRVATGNAQDFSDNAALATMAASVAVDGDPICAMCNNPVARAERWALPSEGFALRMAKFPRWGERPAMHTACGGCFKCGSKSSLDMDGIGGLYCPTHMNQRITAAGGALRASDKAALERTEPMFMRTLNGPAMMRV
jgi:hypothetical protein